MRADLSGPTQRDRPTYPIIALQELVRNAVNYRNYEGTAAPVRVTWLDDRVEIASPGGPYTTVTIEAFGRPGLTDYRNPALGDAARATGVHQEIRLGHSACPRGVGTERQSSARIQRGTQLHQHRHSGRAMKTIGFFNNKGGVGKTSLVYHVAWMLAERGISLLAVDLDPQANLTAMLLEEERIEELWGADPRPTLHGAVSLQFPGTGDINPPHTESITNSLWLLVGDLALSRLEDDLSAAWPRCANGDERSFRVMSTFHRTIADAGKRVAAIVALIDVGPNLGALNRTALLGCDHIVVPLRPVFPAGAAQHGTDPSGLAGHLAGFIPQESRLFTRATDRNHGPRRLRHHASFGSGGAARPCLWPLDRADSRPLPRTYFERAQRYHDGCRRRSPLPCGCSRITTP